MPVWLTVTGPSVCVTLAKLDRGTIAPLVPGTSIPASSASDQTMFGLYSRMTS